MHRHPKQTSGQTSGPSTEYSRIARKSLVGKESIRIRWPWGRGERWKEKGRLLGERSTPLVFLVPGTALLGHAQRVEVPPAYGGWVKGEVLMCLGTWRFPSSNGLRLCDLFWVFGGLLIRSLIPIQNHVFLAGWVGGVNFAALQPLGHLGNVQPRCLKGSVAPNSFSKDLHTSASSVFKAQIVVSQVVEMTYLRNSNNIESLPHNFAVCCSRISFAPQPGLLIVKNRQNGSNMGVIMCHFS